MWIIRPKYTISWKVPFIHSFCHGKWYYSEVIMSAMTSQITCVYIGCATVCLGVDQRKHQSAASLVFVRGIHRWPFDSPHTGSVIREMFSFEDVIMNGANHDNHTQVRTICGSFCVSQNYVLYSVFDIDEPYMTSSYILQLQSGTNNNWFPWEFFIENFTDLYSWLNVLSENINRVCHNYTIICVKVNMKLIEHHGFPYSL